LDENPQYADAALGSVQVPMSFAHQRIHVEVHPSVAGAMHIAAANVARYTNYA
jgi:hypothetical protein